MATSPMKASEILERLAVQQQGIVEAAKTLREIGSLDGAIESRKREIQALDGQINTMRKKLDESRASCDKAAAEAAQVVTTARQHADEILSGARDAADKMMQEAHTRADRERKELQEQLDAFTASTRAELAEQERLRKEAIKLTEEAQARAAQAAAERDTIEKQLEQSLKSLRKFIDTEE